MYLFARTLLDIGYKRIFLRIRSEIRKKIDRKLFLKGKLFFSNFKEIDAIWNFDLLLFDSQYEKTLYKNDFKSKQIAFTFLGEKRSFYIPLKWNNFGSSRLWQFNLHYFDWAKEWLEYRIEHNVWPEESSYLELLIDDWIDNNEPGIGDGWHSYTLSLRIRNWIYLFRASPDLITKKRIKSLWMQICWLNTHQENSYGGNHLLENLITLAIASLQFKGEYAFRIYSNSIRKLQKELKEQILHDGGHFERSAGYHFLILGRLTDLAFILQKLSDQIPEWLLESIIKMLEWAKKVILYGNSLPRFNDSSEDICFSPEIIIEYSESLLNNKEYNWKGLRKLIYNSKFKKRIENPNFKPNDLLIDLSETGWTILKPGNEIELLFKCGIPCPNYLPGHAHSDQLSFDIFKSGEPIIAETGTSIYQKSFERSFERSGAAHNVLQLGLVEGLNNINWIEPVEVWDEFRAARKSKPLYRKFGKTKDGSLWVQGEHDGYKKYGAFHKRFLKISKNEKGEFYLFLNDKVYVKKLMALRIWFHLGNKQEKKFLYPVIKELKEKHKLNFSWEQTWYSKKFGQRIPRKSLCISGLINQGHHDFSLKLQLSK